MAVVGFGLWPSRSVVRPRPPSVNVETFKNIKFVKCFVSITKLSFLTAFHDIFQI